MVVESRFPELPCKRVAHACVCVRDFHDCRCFGEDDTTRVGHFEVEA
jgi:hypothetical protein